MSLIIGIKCPNCNKYCELESETMGNTISMNKFYGKGFTLGTPEIELDGDIKEVDDIDDISSELKQIRIHCQECGDYVVLEDWK